MLFFGGLFLLLLGLAREVDHWSLVLFFCSRSMYLGSRNRFGLFRLILHRPFRIARIFTVAEVIKEARTRFLLAVSIDAYILIVFRPAAVGNVARPYEPSVGLADILGHLVHMDIRRYTEHRHVPIKRIHKAFYNVARPFFSHAGICSKHLDRL